LFKHELSIDFWMIEVKWS